MSIPQKEKPRAQQIRCARGLFMTSYKGKDCASLKIFPKMHYHKSFGTPIHPFFGELVANPGDKPWEFHQ